MIHSRKLAVVRYIKLFEEDKPLVESVLQAISEGATPKLEFLDINLSLYYALDIDAGLLSRAVIKVNGGCGIVDGHSGQLEAIFSAIIQRQDVALKGLVVHSNAVKSVSPGIIASAAVKLESLYLHSNQAQVEEVLIRLAAAEDSNLRELHLGRRDLLDQKFDISHLSPEILIRALLQLDLDILELSSFNFSTEQVYHLLSKIRDSDLQLAHFSLSGNDVFSQVPPQLMASAFSNLEAVVLYDWNVVSSEQLLAIFNMLAGQELGGSKLKSLGIIIIDEMSTIPPEVLVEAIRRLEEIRLFRLSLTADQINAILAAVTEGREGMLKFSKMNISISADSVGTVSQTLLERAEQVNNLLEIEFLD